jgi:hypothetical protein
MLGIDPAIAANQEGGRQSQDASIERRNTLVTHGHGIVHPVLTVELPYGLQAVVERNADNHQSLVAVTLL